MDPIPYPCPINRLAIIQFHKRNRDRPHEAHD